MTKCDRCGNECGKAAQTAATTHRPTKAAQQLAKELDLTPSTLGEWDAMKRLAGTLHMVRDHRSLLERIRKYISAWRIGDRIPAARVFDDLDTILLSVGR